MTCDLLYVLDAGCCGKLLDAVIVGSKEILEEKGLLRQSPNIRSCEAIGLQSPTVAK
jgi:hypothetical protein